MLEEFDHRSNEMIVRSIGSWIVIHSDVLVFVRPQFPGEFHFVGRLIGEKEMFRQKMKRDVTTARKTNEDQTISCQDKIKSRGIGRFEKFFFKGRFHRWRRTTDLGSTHLSHRRRIEEMSFDFIDECARREGFQRLSKIELIDEIRWNVQRINATLIVNQFFDESTETRRNTNVSNTLQHSSANEETRATTYFKR